MGSPSIKESTGENAAMKIPQIRESEVTDESTFLNRRDLIRLGATAAIGGALVGCPRTALRLQGDQSVSQGP